MLLQNSQLIIQITLIIVIITGIISSQLIVRRLKVIRETYASLNEMVGALDSSIEQADKIFDTLRREVSKGDKRLSALLDHARNMEEDLADQYKMVQESTASLEEIMQGGQKCEESLSHAVNDVQAAIEELQKHVEKAELASRYIAEQMKEVEKSRAEMRANAESVTAAEEVMRNSSAEEVQDEGEAGRAIEDARHDEEEQDVSPHFVDEIARPVPEALRSPRPYLRRNGLSKAKEEQ